MARRSSWCWVAVLLLLLFVTTHGLRQPTSQIEGHEARTTVRSRGGSRFNPKAIEGLETTPVPFSSSSPNPIRSRNVRKGGSRADDVTRSERIETATLKSRRGHDQDIKLTTGHGRKSGGTSVAPTSPDRRRVTSNFSSRKSSKDISQRGSLGTLTETTKDARNDRKIESVVPKETDEPRRVGLFRTRNPGGSRSGSSSSTTTTTEESPISSSEESTSNRQLDATGPSVFSGTTEIPRSRTGRKIQTTLSSRGLKLELPSSGRYTSSTKHSERSSRIAERRSDNLSTKGKQDIVPSGSESISIDIPLVGDVTVRPRSVHSVAVSPAGLSETSTGFSSRKKTSLDADKRGRNRGRSNDGRLDSDSKADLSPRSGSRRGASRFSGTTVPDDSSQKTFRSRNEAGLSGNSGTKIGISDRNEGTTRARGRDQTVGEKMGNPSSRSGSLGRNKNRNSDVQGRRGEAKPATFSKKSSVTEERGRSRVKSRAIGNNVVTPTTTVTSVNPTLSSTIPTITEFSTQPSVTSTKIPTDSQQRTPGLLNRADDTVEVKGSGNRGRTAPITPPGKKLGREDFFNHGLGFRGRKIATEAPKVVTSQSAGVDTKSNVETPPMGNPGWTLKRKPSYHQEVTAIPGSSSSTMAGIGSTTISNEIPASNRVVQTTISTVTEKIDRGNRRPFRPSNDVDNPVRPNKNTKKTYGQSKVNGEFEENDNYPPEFKAKLAQLKNVQVATPRPSLGGIGKKRPLTDPEFVARSRQKLESAKKTIVRPEIKNEAENGSIGEEKRTATRTVAPSPIGTGKIAKVDLKTTKSIFSPTNLEKANISNVAKGFESTKDDPKANKSIRPVTTGRNEKESARINKTDKNDERTELTTSNVIPDAKSLVVSTTSSILSRRAKELPRDRVSTTTRRSRAWIAKHIDKNFREPTDRPRKSTETSTKRSPVLTTTTRKSRAPWNAPYIDRNWQEPTAKSVTTEGTSRITKISRIPNNNEKRRDSTVKTLTNDESPTMQSISSSSTENLKIRNLPTLTETDSSEPTSATTEKPVNRFTRKRPETIEPLGTVPKSPADQRSVNSSRRPEHRPRTATYRRHSELPKVMVVNAVPAGKTYTTGNSIAITPKAPTKFHATVRTTDESSSQRSAREEPTVNVKISGDNEKTNIVRTSSGIVGNSNGASGSNIFSPTRSTLLLNSNATLLEQLRSTVAPLLNALGNRTPIFATAYKDIANNSNSGPKITPSGSPPRFSARYKGAELFVRRPNVLEPAGPFFGSSTTPFAPTEDTGSAPPITVESPGEPKVITFYQSLESASITNEIEQTDLQQQVGSNAQVDARYATDSDSNGTNNANNDTITTTTTTTALPSTLVPINVTTVASITKNVSPITTTNTSQTSDTTSEQDNTTVTPKVATMTTDTTDTTTFVEDNVKTTSNYVTQEAPSGQSTTTQDKVVGTTPEGTPPSLRLDTTTVMSLQSMNTVFASTVMSTEAPMIEDDSSLRITTISPPVGRIVYLETETNAAATTESVDTTTSGSIGTTGILSETSIAQNLVDSSLITDRAISEVDVVTTVLPSSEVPPTTTMVTTNDVFNGQSEESETSSQITTISETTRPEATTSLILNSTVEVVVRTVTPASETVTKANPTPMVETISPDTATTSIPNATLEFVVQTVTPVLETTTNQPPPPLESLSLETTPKFSDNSTLEVVVETASPAFDTVQMTDANTISDLTTSVTTGDPASSSVSPDSSDGTSSTIFGETTTARTLEVQARFEDSPTTVPVTEVESVFTSTPLISSTTDAEVTDITMRFPNPSGTIESSTRGQSMLDMIRARIGNETDLPSLSGDSLLSRMMTRLMMTLFSDTSEETGSSLNSLNSSGNEMTTQSPKPPAKSESTNSSSVEEVPQLLGGFLDNTDGNVTSNNASSKDETVGTTEIVETTPGIEVQSAQPVETTRSFLTATTSTPEVTTQVTTTPITPSIATSPLDQLALTPSATIEVVGDQTGTSSDPQEDVASTPATDDTNVTTNQPSETTLTPSDTVELLETRLTNDLEQPNLMSNNDSVINNVTTTGYGEVMTNTNVPEITTTSIPESSPYFSNDNPNSLARFQDTTTATAQRTAGDDVQATPQPEQPTVPDTTTPSITTNSPTSGITVTTTTGIPTTISTSTPESPTTVPSTTTQSLTSSSANFNETSTQTSVEPSQQTTTTEPNVVSVESTIPTTSQSAESTTSSEATTANANATTELPTMATEATTTLMNVTNNNDITTSSTSSDLVMTPMSTTTPSPATTQYLGRFGGSRITPAPRFSASSSTKTPLRDYLIYGIFPNKTIVRKRPEDNLIDARNVDSPYVIFGIFPDGKLVRKFPNGTVIPDPPTNPVEVVFTLSTTTSTTNRPRPVFIDNQQANPVYNYNQNADLYNNRPTSILAGTGGQPGGLPSQINLGLSGNSIGPNGDGPASQPTATKMSDLLLNTQMGTTLGAATKINGLLTDTLNPVTTGQPAIVTPSNVNPQGGRFIQDRERDEASRTREAGGQRSTVYIGQEKFINYWTDGNNTKNNSRLVSVKINSVASAVNESPSSMNGSQPTSFDILPNNQSSDVGQVTAPPGFPWKDPLDQIFGITTQSSIITASVASNTLDDTNPSRSPIMSTTINPLVEVFSPLSAIAGSASSAGPSTSTGTPDPAPAIATTTTAAPKTTTTTVAPPTTTTTTTAAPKTTTTTVATPTTTTAAPETTTTVPTTTSSTTTTTTTTTTAATTSTTTVAPTTVDVPRQTAFGTTFDDLAFLNSLLQSPSVEATTPKTLTDVEQLLANKILSLALGNAGPTRSPKSIQSGDASPNSVFLNPSPGPSSRPIIIDLLQTTSTTPRPVPTVVPTKQVTWRPVSIATPTVTTVKMADTPTTTRTTTVPPVRTTQTSQSIQRPKVTVVTPTPAPPRGFGAGILQALFGGNLFGIPVTTQKPIQITRKPVRTTSKPLQTTSLPIQTTQDQPLPALSVHVTPRNVLTSKVQSNTPNSLVSGFKPSAITSTVETSTYSNEEDAQFLAALLKAAERGDANGGRNAGITNSQGLSNGDEAFLRSLLNGQLSSLNKPIVTTTTVRTSTYSQADDAKFLAALLRAAEQGAVNGGRGAGASRSPGLSDDDETFLRAILNGQASVKPAEQTPLGTSDAALLASLLKSQGIEPSTPANRLREQLQSANVNGLQTTTRPTTTRPRTVPSTTRKLVTSRPRITPTTWSPSSTYPPPLFSNFANFGSAPERPRGGNGVEGLAGDGSVRSQVFNAAIGATRAFSQFLGAAITGAAQQLQSFVRNGTS